MEKAHEQTALYRCERMPNRAAWVLERIYVALQEKGYDPISQLVGYLLSGDPTYITSHREARALVRMVERDELLEELVRTYVEKSTSIARLSRKGRDVS